MADEEEHQGGDAVDSAVAADHPHLPRITATIIGVAESVPPPRGFAPDVLDRHLAPEVSRFTSAEIPELGAGLIDQARFWLPNHFLNSILRAEHPDVRRQYVFNFLRRASNAVMEYALAREQTLAFLARGEASLGLYMRALHHWESCLAQSCMAYYTHKRLFGVRDPDPDDFVRMARLYNHSKHAEGLITGGHHAKDSTLVVWMANDGLTSNQDLLKWHECADALSAFAEAADVVSDPLTMKAKIEKLRDTHPPG